MTDLPDWCPGKNIQKGESFTCTRFHQQGKTCAPCYREMQTHA